MTLTGIPAGEKIDFDELYEFMLRRAPGRDATATARKEADKPEFLCGVVDSVTTGAPITAIIRNSDQHSRDYEKLRYTPRPSHSDYAAFVKYGGNNDIRGGGAFSGRLTAPLCIAGGIAKQILSRRGIEVGAHVRVICGVCDETFDEVNPGDVTAPAKKAFPVIDDAAGEKMREAILNAKAKGDSVGGSVECAVTGMPAGFGGPLFDGVEGKLAHALFGIPAVKGVEFGAGFKVANMYGSENNDAFAYSDGKVVTTTNHSGGIQGGITNGMPLIVHVALKPTPSIAMEQKTVNLETKEETTLVIGGRHDPCVVVRAVPAVEAAVALCILDLLEETN
ncbi:MAG: chorismate synthase [Clostridia bacterium]|nr:chorismate synthase [Clostridia bacterium]